MIECVAAEGYLLQSRSSLHDTALKDLPGNPVECVIWVRTGTIRGDIIDRACPGARVTKGCITGIRAKDAIPNGGQVDEGDVQLLSLSQIADCFEDRCLVSLPSGSTCTTSVVVHN